MRIVISIRLPPNGEMTETLANGDRAATSKAIMGSGKADVVYVR